MRLRLRAQFRVDDALLRDFAPLDSFEARRVVVFGRASRNAANDESPPPPPRRDGALTAVAGASCRTTFRFALHYEFVRLLAIEVSERHRRAARR